MLHEVRLTMWHSLMHVRHGSRMIWDLRWHHRMKRIRWISHWWWFLLDFLVLLIPKSFWNRWFPLLIFVLLDCSAHIFTLSFLGHLGRRDTALSQRCRNVQRSTIWMDAMVLEHSLVSLSSGGSQHEANRRFSCDLRSSFGHDLAFRSNLCEVYLVTVSNRM